MESTCHRWCVNSKHLREFVVGLLVLMSVGFVSYTFSLQDPALAEGSFQPRDNRRHRLGRMSYEQTRALIHKLELRRKQANTPREQAFFAVKLTDVYMQRKMLVQAQKEIELAHRLLPNLPDITARYLMILFHRKRYQQARVVLRSALMKHPNSPSLLRVQKILP